jgi:adenosylmethionine-8-amino-7-oxononanoate aminotransferase
VELAERLVALAPPGLARVFYSDDGSTAVEAALKMALAYHVRRGAPRRRFLALEEGYHGDTVGAMSVSAEGAFTRDFRPVLFPADRIPVTGGGEALRRLLARDGDAYAALLVEPLLMGAAGMRTTPPELLRELREATAHHGVLLVADEVLTGFGRTGAMFGCGAAGVAPDLMCLSKALTGGTLPLGATLATEEIFAAFLGSGLGHAFLHGHSYTGNPIACAAALASLRLLTPERLARGTAIGDRLRRRLAPLRGLAHVADVRGIGPVAAVELRAGGGYLAGLGQDVAEAALARGVLLRPLGPVVYALPPLCVTDAEVDLVGEAMEAAVAAAGARAPAAVPSPPPPGNG